jgi:K+/H+ antiporter YhaU regulatory subunit KhtT
MEIRVREQHLPGIGMRYDLAIGDGQSVFVITDTRRRRYLGLVRDGGEPEWQLELPPDHAVTLASLLLGARFTLDTRADEEVATDEVVVDTATLGPASPLLGLSADEVELPGEGAVLLAVISDSTPELVEDEAHYRCQPGDRVVVAGRGTDIAALLDHVAGPAE